MKKIILILLCGLPAAGFSQLYNKAEADKFTYKEIGDTIFVNNKFYVPGDTLFLGKGSAPDNSFLNIYESKGGGFFCFKPRYLPKEISGSYLIYKEREKNKPFSSMVYTDYYAVFISPQLPKKKYVVNWYAALELHEVHL
jgi:hypothetical protein